MRWVCAPLLAPPLGELSAKLTERALMCLSVSHTLGRGSDSLHLNF